MVEFLQDVLLGMTSLRKQVTGIRHDQHGLLDFLLDRDPMQADLVPCEPPETLDIVINGVRYTYQPHSTHVES